MTDKKDGFSGWAQEMREIFRGGTISEFIIHGNIFDLVSYRGTQGAQFLSLKDFLTDVMFAPFDCVLYYNRGAGLSALKGKDELLKFLKMLDQWTGSKLASGSLPRDPDAALDVVDRFIHYCRQRTAIEEGAARLSPLRTAVIIDYAQFIVPRGDYAADRTGELLIRLLEWASDPNILGSQVVIVLVAENLADLARNLVESPYIAKIRIPIPAEDDCLEYLQFLRSKYPDLESSSEVPLDVMARKVVGLTCVNLHHMVAQAAHNSKKITAEYLARVKKELIEKECYGLLEFLESKTTLDHVAGLEEAKTWLREDSRLIRNGRLLSLPMGYLMTGRIGTGKTWLTNCWAGEVGVPFVIFKNFRDRWMGATEGNLEKIFNVLHALGQVIVFVDEADQMTGKRGGGDSDSGLSGRIYAMLAAEMSEPRNRGRIIWVFATSRPDLLEVDLKRPGRLDVHIPLFPPQADAERQQLFGAMARKVKLPIKPEDLPPLPSGIDMGGNEMEALMVRALRRFDLQEPGDQKPLKETLTEVIAEYRPLPHVRNLEYMDLIAVKECTDTRFLPEKFRALSSADLEERIDRLKAELRF